MHVGVVYLYVWRRICRRSCRGILAVCGDAAVRPPASVQDLALTFIRLFSINSLEI